MRARQVNDLEVKQQFHELTFWRNAPFRLQLGNLALEPRELQLLRIHLTLPGKRMLRIIRKRLHPVTQLCWMDTQVLRRPHIRHATILDQPHSLKLELPRKLRCSISISEAMPAQFSAP